MSTVDELYYEKLGASFDCFMSPYDVRQRTRLIEALLPTDRRWSNALEVGCGTGAITQALAGRVGELTVTDISEKLARRVGEDLGCRWAAADACALSFPDVSFELVFSSECIEHTRDPVSALREMARVVRPGGQLVVTTPNRLWFPIVWMAARLRLRRFRGPEQWITPRLACEVLTQAGLVVRRVRGCHLYPWQIPTAKLVLPGFDRLGEWLYPLMINFGILAERPHTT